MEWNSFEIFRIQLTAWCCCWGPPVNIIPHCHLGPQAGRPVYVFLTDIFLPPRLYFSSVCVVWDSAYRSALSGHPRAPHLLPWALASSLARRPSRQPFDRCTSTWGNLIAPVPSFAALSTPRAASLSSARRLHLGAGIPELHWSERVVRSSPHRASRSCR
jgi:hypothetical protein